MAAVALLRAFLSSRRLIEAALRFDSRSSFGIATLARLAAAAAQAAAVRARPAAARSASCGAQPASSLSRSIQYWK